jgi:hypothetical protein
MLRDIPEARRSHMWNAPCSQQLHTPARFGRLVSLKANKNCYVRKESALESAAAKWRYSLRFIISV